MKRILLSGLLASVVGVMSGCASDGPRTTTTSETTEQTTVHRAAPTTTTTTTEQTMVRPANQ